MAGKMKRTGVISLLKQLIQDEITCIFGNPGSSEENILDALRAKDFKKLKYYLAFHEGTAVAMADAYARASRSPAIVQLHSYAGLANGLGMMYGAKRGYTPLVVIAGEAGLKYEALDGQMSADLVKMASPFVKSDHHGPCAWQVVDSNSVLRLLRRAIKSAMTPPHGPVFLALPMDILDQENTEEVVSTSKVQSVVIPDQAIILEAAYLLAKGNHPLILMGDGIAASAAQKELTELAELLGAVVWGANCSEVNMPFSHPLFAGFTGHMFGKDSKKKISFADVVLICGTTVMPEVFPELRGIFSEQTRIVQFDLNTYEIAKNFPVTLGFLADPKPTLKMLKSELQRILNTQQKSRAEERIRRHQEEKENQRKQRLDEDTSLQERKPMRAARFMEKLFKRLPMDALIFDEALTHSEELCRYRLFDQPGTYFQTRSGMLGTGLPGALGLKLACPDKIVFGFTGDGGGISTIQALSTAARYGIGAKFVICNNRSYRILKYNLREYWNERQEIVNQPFPNEFDLSFPTLRFDKMAEGQGVKAMRVEEPEQIEQAIDQALANDEPFLIDLVLSPELSPYI